MAKELRSSCSNSSRARSERTTVSPTGLDGVGRLLMAASAEGFTKGGACACVHRKAGIRSSNCEPGQPYAVCRSGLTVCIDEGPEGRKGLRI